MLPRNFKFLGATFWIPTMFAYFDFTFLHSISVGTTVSSTGRVTATISCFHLLPTQMLHITEKVQPTRPRGGCCYKSTAGQRAARRLRRSYLRKIRSREYKRLQAIVPSVSKREKIAKVRDTPEQMFLLLSDLPNVIVEEAIKYIDNNSSASYSSSKPFKHMQQGIGFWPNIF